MTDTLTADAVRAMPAGAELDALIVEHVLGWRKVPVPHDPRPDQWQWQTPDGYYHHPGTACGYSTDITDAWEVVEFLAGQGCTFALSVRDSLWTMLLTRTTRPRSNCICTGETAPLAICRAALLAVTES